MSPRADHSPRPGHATLTNTLIPAIVSGFRQTGSTAARLPDLSPIGIFDQGLANVYQSSNRQRTGVNTTLDLHNENDAARPR
jgi:hypothetical protein